MSISNQLSFLSIVGLLGGHFPCEVFILSIRRCWLQFSEPLLVATTFCNPGLMLTLVCRSHKVVIFVLDELDIFARKPKQTLLYNLLDAMQAADMQVNKCKLARQHS